MSSLNEPLQQDERAAEWVAAFAEAWRAPAGPEEFARAVRPLLAPDIGLIGPQLPEMTGIDAFETGFVAPVFALISGAHASVESWASRGDRLYIELELRGRIGKRPVKLRVCDRITLDQGLATERESYFDPTPLLAAVALSPRSWRTLLDARVRGSRARSGQPQPKQEDTMKELTLPQGTIRYRESGNGSPIVLVHGLLTNGELWRDVAPLLAADHRVIVPDWPLGSQELPLNADADVSPPAMAQLIPDFLDALDLRDVTLVGNDTGGALCQMAAVSRPERLARLVLTPCDAYEHFPPPAFAPLVAIAHVPGAVGLILQASRLRAVRRLPNTYGALTVKPHDELTASFVRPARLNAQVRRQTARFLTGFNKRHTLAAAARFPEFDKPVLIAWAREDRFFKVADGERLARDFPNARLEVLDGCRTFMMLDRPKELAELIAAFAREPAGDRTAAALSE